MASDTATANNLPAFIWDEALIRRYDLSGPRYTSYPTAVEFTPNYSIEDMLKDAENIDLLVQRKSNSKKQHEPYVDYLISSMRKRIETTFSEISNFLPKKIHAVTEFGFLLKVVIFIFGYAISRTLI